MSIREKYRERGPWGLVLSAGLRVPGVKTLCVYYVYHMDAGRLEARPASTGQVTGVGKEVLEASGRLDDLLMIQDKRDLFVERFARGDYCMICYVDGVPAGYVWCQSGTTHVEERLGFLVEVGPDEMYCYDIYVLREFRRENVAREMTYGLIHYCGNVLGKKMITAIIEVHNQRSIRANEKIGWRRSHLGCYVEAFGRTWHRPRF